MWWITADWHLGETRLDLMGRPYSSPQEHIESLIREHNTFVLPDDVVYVNGDVCYKNSPESLPLVARFNGKKILIRGNHDRGLTNEQLKPYFDTIIPEGMGTSYKIEDIECFITHYPTRGLQKYFNLVGHIHHAWKYQLNMMNVGVDVHHFKPVNLNKIPFHLNAIKTFYDQDVWIAYDPINASYVGKRGKEGSYFKPRYS